MSNAHSSINMPIKYSPELKECAEGHYQAVVELDEYRIRELAEGDKEIKYIVDLGANVGMFSMHAQNIFPNAKIIACEPDSESMKYVKLNTDDKLIYVEEAIIGDDRKEVTFNVCKWAGNSHVDGNFRWDLFEPMGSRLDHKITVPASTLKDIIDKHNFPRIDLLKIDTEGMEGQILQAFKPYMSLVKHIRGEWHGDKEIPLIKDALQDTHDIYFDHRLKTHGDVFALRKDFPTIENDYGEYKVLKRLGLPDRIISK